MYQTLWPLTCIVCHIVPATPLFFQGIHDAAEEFWASSGIVNILQGYDVILLEVALQDSQPRNSQNRAGLEQNKLQVCTDRPLKLFDTAKCRVISHSFHCVNVTVQLAISQHTSTDPGSKEFC